MRAPIYLLPIIIYSPSVFACAMESKGEQALAFLVYLVSAGLAIYAVFSRLSYNSKMFFIPLVISLIFGYMGLAEIGCVESSPVKSSLITFFGIAILAIYETYARKKHNRRIRESSIASES